MLYNMLYQDFVSVVALENRKISDITAYIRCGSRSLAHDIYVDVTLEDFFSASQIKSCHTALDRHNLRQGLVDLSVQTAGVSYPGKAKLPF